MLTPSFMQNYLISLKQNLNQGKSMDTILETYSSFTYLVDLYLPEAHVGVPSPQSSCHLLSQRTSVLLYRTQLFKMKNQNKV